MTLLLGVVREKDLGGVIGRTPLVARAVPGDGHRDKCARHRPLDACRGPGHRIGRARSPIADTDDALDDALGRASKSDGIVVVAGSLYLVGHVRARLLGLEKD